MRSPLAGSKRANRTGRDADPCRTIKLNSAAWQRLRAAVLGREPLCRHCAARGLVVPATDVDHMNGADDNRLESLQPLCHECHSRKTARDQGKRVAYGCDPSGKPADPDHPWNRPAVPRPPDPQLDLLPEIARNRPT